MMFDYFVKLFTTISPDFQVLFLSAIDLVKLGNPYINNSIFTQNTNLPNTLVFYLPFTIFNYLTAQSLFTLLSIVAVVISIFIIAKILNIKFNFYYLLISLILVLASFPSRFTIEMGQSNFFTLLLLLCSYYFYKKSKFVLSGLFLGLLISYKIIFLYIFLFFIIKKEWKILITAITVFLSTTLLVGIVSGSFEVYKYYFLNVIPPLANFTDREVYFNQGISSFISRMIIDSEWRKIVTVVISFAIVFINYLGISNDKKQDSQFSITILTLLLIDTFSWQHHFVLLIFPLILLWKAVKSFSLNKVLLVIAYILVSLNIPGYMFNSNVFLGTMLLYYLNLKYLK